MPGVSQSPEVRGRVREETPRRRDTRLLATVQAGANEECNGLDGTDSAARSGDGSVASPNKAMEKQQEASEERTTVLRREASFIERKRRAQGSGVMKRCFSGCRV